MTRLETDRGSSYPGNAALGVVDDVELTEQVAAAIGADLAAVGVEPRLRAGRRRERRTRRTR